MRDGTETRAAFLARFGHVAEYSPWVAEAAWKAAPFSTVEEVVNAFRQAIVDAPERQLMALIRAHPDLAGTVAVAGELGPQSSSEQASAGLDRLSTDDFDRFTRLNSAYRARFGFPFIICAREHTLESILDRFERRLDHDPRREVETARDEIVKIVELRIRDQSLTDERSRN